MGGAYYQIEEVEMVLWWRSVWELCVISAVVVSYNFRRFAAVCGGHFRRFATAISGSSPDAPLSALFPRKPELFGLWPLFATVCSTH